MYFKCKYCGWFGKRPDFEIDHEIPISRLGLSQLFNPTISLICSGCNRQKGNMTPSEYSLWRLLNFHRANYGPMKAG